MSIVLHTVVSQQLVPGVGGGLVPAFEVMHVNSGIRPLVFCPAPGKISRNGKRGLTIRSREDILVKHDTKKRKEAHKMLKVDMFKVFAAETGNGRNQRDFCAPSGWI